MKRTITIEITVDTQSGKVTDMDITNESGGRTEFVADGVDDPVSCREVVNYIQMELVDLIRK